MLKYIYWKNEETYVILKINEFNEKFDYYKKNGKLVKYKTLRDVWSKKSYLYEQKGYYRHLYTYEGPGKYMHYTCNYIDDSKNKLEVRQSNATAIAFYIRNGYRILEEKESCYFRIKELNTLS